MLTTLSNWSLFIHRNLPNFSRLHGYICYFRHILQVFLKVSCELSIKAYWVVSNIGKPLSLFCHNCNQLVWNATWPSTFPDHSQNYAKNHHSHPSTTVLHVLLMLKKNLAQLILSWLTGMLSLLKNLNSLGEPARL